MMAVSLLGAATLDLILGDPRWLPHPVRWIGAFIAICDKRFYPRIKSRQGEFFAGAGVCVIVLVVTIACGLFFFAACRSVSHWLLMAGEALIGFYCLSAKSLAQEADVVRKYLAAGDLGQARKALSMIVGRDTAHLDEAGIVRATVETVAENITDGIVSPLFYLAFGGPVTALAFKAVSTMDSMIGYKNERYLHFGTCAARLDDVLNFIPARLTAFFIIPCAAFFLRLDWKQSLRIAVRDRLKHESPNSAHGEAAMAGALHIQLGGKAYYSGALSLKPLLGDEASAPETNHIAQAAESAITATFITALIASAILIVISKGKLF